MTQQRRSVSDIVLSLATSNLTTGQIAQAVRRELKDSHATARSVSAVLRNLRKIHGDEVVPRRQRGPRIVPAELDFPLED